MLCGEKVNIRPLVEHDLPVLLNWHLKMIETPYEQYPLRSEAEIISSFMKDRWWRKYNGVFIVEKKDETPLGLLRFDADIDNLRCGIRQYIVKEGERGKGYGSDALRCLVEYLFDRYPIVRIDAACHPENIGAIKSLENVHFTREGIERKAFFVHGKSTDLLIFSLLREEYEEHKSTFQR